jgi:hypothetical protein
LLVLDFYILLLPHDKVLDLIAMLDFGGVDIGLFDPLPPGRRGVQNPSQSRSLLSRKLADRGLRCADVFLQADPNLPATPSIIPNCSPRRPIGFSKRWSGRLAAQARYNFARCPFRR